MKPQKLNSVHVNQITNPTHPFNWNQFWTNKFKY